MLVNSNLQAFPAGLSPSPVSPAGEQAHGGFFPPLRQTSLACLLTLFGMLGWAVEIRTQDLAADRATLVALYNATNGPSWSNNGNWLSNEPVGNWYGVTVTNGRVTRLHLRDNQLTGIIPTELGDLANLEHLSLSRNQLTGAIPAELGDLANLERLSLHSNQLTGAIPTELGDLANLQGLWLHTNRLTGIIPTELDSIASLRWLSLSRNQLTGAIPTELGNLANLEWLQLSHNQLTGAIPAELGDLVNLERLYLSRNQLTGAIPAELGNLDSLQWLWLHSNQLTGAIPAELGDLTNLQGLWLHTNQLTGIIPTELGDLANLERLSLSRNRLTGAIPTELRNLANLEWLQLSHNQLAEAIPAELGDLVNLERLYLSRNQLTGAVPAELGNLVNLERLYLHSNKLTGPLPQRLRELPSLEYLSFDSLPLTPERSVGLFVPVILSSAGQNNSFFTSELTLTNRGTKDATLHYTYTADRGGGNGTASDVLAAGRQRVKTNALDYLRSLGVPIPETGNRIGTLRVEVPLGAEVEAVVRTTTVVPDGRAGLTYPGVAQAEGVDEAVYLCGLRQNGQDRSNVAVQNAGGAGEESITLRVTVFSGDSTSSGRSKVLPDLLTLPPGGFHQYNGILNMAGFDNGYVKVERVEGEAPFYAYGVINDQANSDGSFVFPVTASSLEGKKGQTLPVIVETRDFTSELTVTNFSDAPRMLNFQFVAEQIKTVDKTASFSMELEAGEQAIVPGLVEELRGEVAGLGTTRGYYAGPLFVEAEDMSGIVIGARTGSEVGGGQYSVFYNAVPFGAAIDDEAWVYGLQQNEENRSNLALVNTGEVDGGDSIFNLEIYDGATGQLTNTIAGVRVSALGWYQINGILRDYAPETRQGYIRILKVAGENPFLAYGVVNDGGAPGQRSGDGAYLPARETIRDAGTAGGTDR